MTIKTYDEQPASMKTTREAKGGTAGLYRVNINVPNRDTLKNTMEHPEKYPNLMARTSGYTVSFVRLTREQQLDVLSRTFHTGK